MSKFSEKDKNQQSRHTRKIGEEITSQIKITIPTNKNKILEEVLSRVNVNRELKTLWKIINVNAIERLGYTDHGPTHFNVVANYALEIARILNKNGVQMSVVRDFGLTYEHAEVVIFLASIMHDLGMSIHRVNHEQFSLFIARDLLKEILDFMPIEERTVIISETLHAIISHSHGSAGKTSTIEGGIVRIADALDMSKGRSRIPYQMGKVDIHSVSANAIDSVLVKEGKEKPIEIEIIMSNEAGVFQADDFVEEKLSTSGLSKYIRVRSFLEVGGKKKIYKDYIL
jgi:hypothetical protein